MRLYVRANTITPPLSLGFGNDEGRKLIASRFCGSRKSPTRGGSMQAESHEGFKVKLATPRDSTPVDVQSEYRELLKMVSNRGTFGSILYCEKSKSFRYSLDFTSILKLFVLKKNTGFLRLLPLKALAQNVQD